MRTYNILPEFFELLFGLVNTNTYVLQKEHFPERFGLFQETSSLFGKVLFLRNKQTNKRILVSGFLCVQSLHASIHTQQLVVHRPSIQISHIGVPERC